MAQEKRLTHAERAERRKRIAEEFRRLMDQGKDINECFRRVSSKYKVTPQMVYSACLQNQIKVPRRLGKQQLPAPSTLEIIADIIRGKKGIEIAKEKNLSRQRIFQIQEQAEKAGLLDAVEQRVKAAKKTT